MLDFRVRNERCTGCGLCVSDCPARIIEQDDNRRPFVASQSAENCLECQHCLAICPAGAISVFGLDPDASLPVSAEAWPDLVQMSHLLRGRRSVRHYRDENVATQLIDRLLATVANSPTGVNYRNLTFSVIDDRVKLQQFREKVMQALTKAAEEGRLAERFAYLQNAISAYVEHQADVIFRGAPHVLLVSASPQAPCAGEDVTIALSYFELLAQSAGLGTVWCGFLKLSLEAVPSLKPLFGLLPGQHYYPMLFGYPAISYARTVQRDKAATVKRL